MNEEIETYTEGPWSFGDGDSVLSSDYEVRSIVGPNGEEVLTIGWGGSACESDPSGAYPILEASDADWAAIKAAPEMLALLEELEFAASSESYPGADKWDSYCYFCGRGEEKGHHDDCELGLLLKKAKGLP